MKKMIISIATAGVLASSAAVAQTTVIETTGAAPPDEVITYVQRERVPSVRVEGTVATGWTVPGSVELHAIPRQERYRYTVVNEKRVIVDPSTRKVIRIIE